MFKRFKEFCTLTRAYSLSASITPFFVAACFTYHYQTYKNLLFWAEIVLLLFGVVLVHLAGNLYDDYRDVKSALEGGCPLNRINFGNKEKAKLILNETFSMPEVKLIITELFFAAFVIGLYFYTVWGFSILALMFVTLFLCAVYPVSAKIGLSELIIGVLFGPLLINGVYFASSGHVNYGLVLFSVSSGIMTTILLITHSLMDYEHDKECGKETLPVMLGDKKRTVALIAILILAAYVILFKNTLYFRESPFIMFLPIVLTFPLGIKLIYSLEEYIEMRDVKFTPRWYYGIMENWEEIVKNNNAYFMFRFYLARNLGLIFNIALGIAILFMPILKEQIKTLFIY